MAHHGETVNDVGNYDLAEEGYEDRDSGADNVPDVDMMTDTTTTVSFQRSAVPMSQREARRQLQDLLGNPTGRDNDEANNDDQDQDQEQRAMMFSDDYWREDMKWMLELLSLHPELASEYFEYDDNQSSDNDSEESLSVDGPCLPLLCCLLRVAQHSDDNLLDDDTGLQALQAIYELNPAALSQPQGHDNELPLHLACQHYVCYHASQLIHFWMTQYPAALSHVDSFGNLPIHHAIRNHSLPNSLLREMIELCPKCAYVSNNSGETPLRLSWFHSSWDVQVMRLIIQLYPEDAEDVDLRINDHDGSFTMTDLPQAQAIATLLPQVKRFQCSFYCWTFEALRFFLQQLHSNKTVRRLHLHHVPRAMLMWRPQLCLAMKNMLLFNATMQELELDLGSLPEPKQGIHQPDDSEIFLPLSRGMMGNAELQSITLKNLSFRESRLLGAFLANGAAPKHVTLDHIHVHGDDWIRQSFGVQSCAVESLTLRHLVLSVPCLVALLRQIAHMPHLQQLTVDFVEQSMDEANSNGDDISDDQKCDGMITSVLVTVLSQQRLQSLRVHNKHLDIQPICHELRANDNLREFHFCTNRQDHQACLAEVLEHHNTTLTTVQWHDTATERPEAYNREDARVAYFSCLNQFGRGSARNPQLPIHDFVDLLCAVAHDDQSLLESELQSHNMLHGLLREAPSLWSNSIQEALSFYPTYYSQQTTL